MKKYIFLSLLLTGFEASAASSKIVCEVSGGLNPETLTLENKTGVDLANPGGLFGKVPLHINGEAESTEFEYSAMPTHVGTALRYKYRHPVFISDISILFHIDQVAGKTTFGGTWTIDYPPVLDLKCEFQD